MVIRHELGNFVRSEYFKLLLIPMVIIEITILYHFFISADEWIPEKPPSSFEKQVWIQYNAGYANPATDKQWGEWKTKFTASKNKTNEPPFEIQSKVFPQLGLYSSHNKFLIKKHMRMIARHGIDGVIVNWVPPQKNKFIDDSVKIIFKQARKIGVSVALQIMDYEKRDNLTLSRDIEYIRSNYAPESIYLKFDGYPIIFIDSPQEVYNVHKTIMAFSDRTFFIAMADSRDTYNLALEENFRGIYVDATSENNPWNQRNFNLDITQKDSLSRGIILIPKITPEFHAMGHLASRDNQNRDNGRHYRNMFKYANDCGARIILIDSFNNWKAGTSIEPIVPRPDYPANRVTWSDDQDPEFYLKLTKELVSEFKKK